MRPKTLKKIKQKISEFLPIVKASVHHWHNPEYVTIEVLLTDIVIDNDKEAYSKAERELYESLEMLRLIAEYKKQHFEMWVYKEIKSIIDKAIEEEGTIGYLEG